MGNSLDDYRTYKTTNLLALRAFPRSMGMYTMAITLLLTKEIITALYFGLIVWFVVYILKRIAGPNIVGITIYESCLSMPVTFLSLWVVRIPIFIILTIISLFLGAEILFTIIAFGIVLLNDVITIIRRGS